jgi:hypothetical protein
MDKEKCLSCRRLLSVFMRKESGMDSFARYQSGPRQSNRESSIFDKGFFLAAFDINPGQAAQQMYGWLVVIVQYSP